MKAGDNTGRRGRRSTFAGVATALAIGLLLAACGSSKGASTATTTGSATTGGGSSATTATGGTPAGLAQAEAFVAKYEVQPASITDTTKVTGTIPKGKVVYFIPCGPNPECQQEGQIVKQADDLLGWSTVILPNDGSPQNSKADFDQVVRAKAAAVLYTAIPQSTFQSEIPALRANGTVVSTCCVTDTVGNGIDYAIDVPAQVGPVGGAQAAFLANDSKCTNDSAVVINIPDFAILANGITDFKSALSTYCPGASANGTEHRLGRHRQLEHDGRVLRPGPSFGQVRGCVDRRCDSWAPGGVEGRRLDKCQGHWARRYPDQHPVSALRPRGG